MEWEIHRFIQYLHLVKKTTYNTEVSYERDLRKLAMYLKEHNIETFADVTSEELRKYVKYLTDEGNAPSSVSRTVSSIKTFYNYLLNIGVINRDPAQFIKAPKIVKKVPDTLTYAEVELFLSQPEGNSPKDIRDKAIVELMYSTGLRVSEVINLKLSDINLADRCLACNETNKQRIVPFSEKAKKWLERYLDESREILVKKKETGMLFVNCHGTPMSRQGLWKIIKYYAQMADIDKDITPHMLRHSFAAHMAECGTDLKDIQKILGHSDITTTQIYRDITETSHKEGFLLNEK